MNGLIPIITALSVGTLPGPEAPTLVESAAEAEAVAVVRLTDLSRSGTAEVHARAMADVLVSITGPRSGKRLVITENPETDAAHLRDCPLPEPRERTPRLLVFLDQRDDGTWQKTACAESVLVTVGGQYALRFPMDHHRLGLEVPVEEMAFADAAAWLEPDAIENVIHADRLRNDYFMEDGEHGLRYTRGVVIWKLRMALLGL